MANFQWHPVSATIHFDFLKKSPYYKTAVNHFEFHKEISCKINLLKNLELHCEEKQLYLFDIIPNSFVFDFDSPNLIKDFLEFSNIFSKSSSNLDQKEMNSYEILKNRINFFSTVNTDIRNFLIDNHKKNISKFCKARNHDSLLSYENTCCNNIWIFKPSDLNRGRGIKIFHTYKELLEIIVEESKQNRNKTDKTSIIFNNLKIDCENKSSYFFQKPISKKFIIQKYIEKPMLINDRKFDFRVWVLITQDNEIFFFKEGYIRTSSEKYVLSENLLKNNYIHLTNNAIQKNSKNYGNFEEGNQISFQNLQLYFLNAKINLNIKSIIKKMEKIILLSIESVKQKLNFNDRKHCFEIFGYDFMLDYKHFLWLIEINTNPCLEESSQLLEILIPRMLDDAFKLTIDKIFINKSETNKPVQYPVKGYSDNENMWKLIGRF